MLPPDRIILDPEKDAYLRSIPPLVLSTSDNIIEIHKTKKHQDKWKAKGLDMFGEANLSELEDSETDVKIVDKDGDISVAKDAEEIASSLDYTRPYASDSDAQELL